jgi:hypothetical protein
MGDSCRLCEGPHATRHHGAGIDETPPPQGYPAIVYCDSCHWWHPVGIGCTEDDDEQG